LPDRRRYGAYQDRGARGLDCAPRYSSARQDRRLHAALCTVRRSLRRTARLRRTATADRFSAEEKREAGAATLIAAVQDLVPVVCACIAKVERQGSAAVC